MGQNYTKLNTEGYGGMICATWMDRPLSVAGRVLVQENGAIVSRLVALDRDLLMIPSVAIHMNRNANDGMKFAAKAVCRPAVFIPTIWAIGISSSPRSTRPATTPPCSSSSRTCG